MLKPLGKRVVLKEIEKEQTTKSGLVLPTTAKEKSDIVIAEIVSISEIQDINETTKMLNVGDEVICSKFSMTEIKYNGQDYLVGKIEDILAVID